MTETRKELSALETLSDTLRITSMDYERSYAALSKDPSQYSRRRHFITTFALMEGLTYGLKQVALEMHRELSTRIDKQQSLEKCPQLWERLQPRLSEEEVVLLKEISLEVDQKGSLRCQPKHLQFEKNIRFAMAMASKVFGTAFMPNYSGSGWNALKASTKIRNRLVHPKQANDLSVSDKEIETLNEAI